MKYILNKQTKCCKTAVWKFLKTSKSLKFNGLSLHCWTRMQTAPSSVTIYLDDKPETSGIPGIALFF